MQNIDLRHVLLGQTKPKYQRVHNLSQSFPFRHNNPYAKLFAKHLPADKLTGPLGLANALVFMVSSQCEDTMAFLNGVTFWSDSLEDCIDMYDGFVQKNAHFYTDLHHNPLASSASSGKKSKRGKKKKKKTGFHALNRREQAASGYVHVDSLTIWGQPSRQLGLFPGIPHRDDLTKRFTRLFSADFQTRWTNLLGALFRKDPATFAGKIPSWREMHIFILKLRVSGLGTTNHSSLTAFQLTNHFVFAGLCSPPLLEDITTWIWKMKKAGAYRGLQDLGFDVSSLERTHKSFDCVLQHFTDNLSEEDRTSMGFDLGYGVIFVEHILCKVVRWQNRLVFNCGKEASLVRLGDVAARAEVNGSPWVKGANTENASLFPVPLVMSRDRLIQILVTGELFYILYNPPLEI